MHCGVLPSSTHLREAVVTCTGKELPRRRVKTLRPCASSAQVQGASPRGPALEQRNQLLFAAVEALFKFPPLFELAKNKARAKIVERGRAVGFDFNEEVERVRGAVPDWDGELAAVTNTHVTYPDYYTQSFHGYREGNLGWQPAMEVSAAARAVHATVMDPEGRALDPEGDARLRGGFTSQLRRILGEGTCAQVRDVVDLGCATGLSSLELLRAFPNARVEGIDLSPHFLAVGRLLLRQRQEGLSERVGFRHGAAEATGLPSSSADVVAVSLVFHELPQSAARAVIKEAFRILRPGGCLAINEMNPASPAIGRFMMNPFAYAAFKSTEPWLVDYLTLDMEAAIQEAGFAAAERGPSTPRHITIVAAKP